MSNMVSYFHTLIPVTSRQELEKQRKTNRRYKRQFLSNVFVSSSLHQINIWIYVIQNTCMCHYDKIIFLFSQAHNHIHVYLSYTPRLDKQSSAWNFLSWF